MIDVRENEIRPVRGHRQRLVMDGAIILMLVGITLWRLLPAVESTPFHRDEARWIANATLLREWRDPLGPRWQDEGYRSVYGTLDEETRRRNQAPLFMYVLGASLAVQGKGLPTIGYWIMGRDTAWNTQRGNLPSDSELRASRLTNVIVTALTVICIYVLGLQLTNRFGGMTSALVFAIHPLVRLTSTQAFSDPLLVLLITVGGLAAFRLVAAPTWFRSIVLGVVLGLGTATKLSSLPVAAAMGAIGLAIWAWNVLGPGQVSERLRRIGPRLFAVPIAAALSFVAVYPHLWTDPIDHTRQMFAFRSLSFELQSMDSPAAVPTRPDAIRRVGIELGDRFSASGLVKSWLEERTGTELWASLDYLDLCVAILGLLLMVGIAGRHGLSSPGTVATLVVAGHAAVVLLAMRVEYARYLHPVLLLAAVCIGVATGEAWRLSTRSISRIANPWWRAAGGNRW